MHTSTSTRRAETLTLEQLADGFEKASRLPDSAMLTPDQAAELMSLYGMPIKPITLARWRCVRSTGPAFRKNGRRVLYTAGSIRAFVGASA